MSELDFNDEELVPPYDADDEYIDNEYEYNSQFMILYQNCNESLSFYIAMQPALFLDQYYGSSIVLAKDIYDVVKVCDCCGKLI